MLCTDMLGPIVDRFLYPNIEHHCALGTSTSVPTYNVGGTECVVITRGDAVCWMVYCHGNAVTLRDLFESGVAHEIAECCKCNFVAPAYPVKDAYGARYDTIVIAAARAAYERVSLDSTAPVYVAGRSLGVGVALGACASRPPAGLLLLSGFASVRSMTSWAALRCVVGDRYNNAEAIEADNLHGVHKLIVHGSCDSLVPPEHAMALSNAACNVQVHIVEGMEHNPGAHWPQVYDIFKQFTRQHLEACGSGNVYPVWRTT